MVDGKFDLYIGVDWSGAKGPKLPGFCVSSCGPGSAVPTLVENPEGGVWTRPAFAGWMLAQMHKGHRILCGMDFSFCFPWTDEGAYFPGEEMPGDWRSFWTFVEKHCSAEGFFGGELSEQEPWRQYFAAPIYVGSQYERRLRVTELVCLAQDLGAPDSVFNLRGARQVGKSSLSGMRVLLHMKQHTRQMSIWPFEEPKAGQSVFVETFPTAFVRMAGGGVGKIREVDRLTKVLDYFGCEDASYLKVVSDDETDAMVTAAALRHLSGESHWWHPKELSDSVRRYEGWTFGVR